MSVKVRDLVRSIRACKTAAEERAVIAKECALIRTAFKEEDAQYRQRNVAKLLFIHLLGYPTQFAQMECLKLIASQKFSEKRIGYLGLSQLLDENSDVLMLVTNSIGNDLQHVSQYVNGLALTALGNVGNAEMCMALAQEVNSLIGVSNPYIRKKAVICAVRMVRRVEDITDKFDHRIPSLLEDKNHGVLLATCALMSTLIDLDRSQYVKIFRKYISQLIRILQGLLMSHYSSSAEYDISGITDPFLQTRLLSLLRQICANSHKKADQMSDVLAQLTTNTDGAKSAGNAILYEAVRTIMNIDADSSLRVLGINVLGKFLQNKDNNIRYVALEVFQQVVKVDIKAVQRHRSIVIECLKDNDDSLRRCALEVAFLLIDEENIKGMTKEMLNLLLTSTNEFKDELVSKICMAVERFSPTKRWQVDTLMRAMSLAGNHVKDEVRDSFIQLVAATPELQEYTVHKLYFSVHENMSQETLVQVAVWCIGEYGDLLIVGSTKGPDGSTIKIEAIKVLDLLDQISSRRNCCSFAADNDRPTDVRASDEVSSQNGFTLGGEQSPGFSFGVSPLQITTEFVLTALLKLSIRLPPDQLPQIQKILKKYSKSVSLELQQRSCESEQLFTPLWDDMRQDILDRMPPIPNTRCQNTMSRPTDGEGTESGHKGTTGAGSESKLLDLDNLLDMDDGPGQQSERSQSKNLISASVSAQQASSLAVVGGENLIADLLDGLSLPASTSGTSTATISARSSQPVQTIANEEKTGADNLINILDERIKGLDSMTVFDKNGLHVEIVFLSEYSEESPKLELLAKSTNYSKDSIKSYVFEVAVPKYLKLSLDPASTDTLEAHSGSLVTQKLRLDTSAALEQKKPIALKLRLSYTQRGNLIQEMATVTSLKPKKSKSGLDGSSL